MHGTLQFIDAPDRLRALAGINRALRSGGKLVLQFNTSRQIAAKDAERRRMDYANGVLADLDRLDIPLPDESEKMRRRLIPRWPPRTTRGQLCRDGRCRASACGGGLRGRRMHVDGRRRRALRRQHGVGFRQAAVHGGCGREAARALKSGLSVIELRSSLES